MSRALYGPAGFYTANPPRQHFRTSVQYPVFGQAIAALVVQVDAALDHPAPFTVVDVGAAEGSLLRAVAANTPPELLARLQLVGVELRPAPANLPQRVEWTEELPRDITGLLIAHEYLDNVPLDTAAAGRYLTTSGDRGAAMSDRDAAWAARWWPGSRYVELGTARDDAWRQLTATLATGAALCVDYGHTAQTRPSAPTLRSFRDGAVTAVTWDGSADITADVAMDSVAAAGEAIGMATVQETTQRTALAALGFAGTQPPHALASSDPTSYLAELAAASHLAELRRSGGMGAFCWLLQATDSAISARLAGCLT